MSRPLDFVVHGVARSGTTALREALELEPSVFCANEFFRHPLRVDHAALRAPDCFLDPASAAAHPGKGPNSRLRLVARLAAGPVRLYGNKQPPYLRILDRLHRGNPGLASLCIHRPFAEIARSWDRRAARGVDKWADDRTGAIAAYEWLLMVARLAETPHRVSVVDYHGLFDDDPGLLVPALAAIGVAAPDPALVAQFRAGIFRGGAPAGPAPDDAHAALATATGVGGLDAAFARAGCAPAAAVAPQCAEFVAAAADAFRDALLVAGATSPERIRVWGLRVLREWDDPAARFHPVLRRHVRSLLEALGPPTTEAGQAQLAAVVTLLAPIDAAMAGALKGLARAAPAPAPAAPKARRALKQAHVHFGEGKRLAEADRLPEAIVAVGQAAALAPEHPRFATLLGKLHLRVGDRAAAAAAFGQALAAGPGSDWLRAAHARAIGANDRGE